MKSVDLRLLQETSQGSLSKLREVAQGLKRKFPKVQVPSVLERSPEKDLFKATKIIEDLSETAIVDEYIDYTSRKVLGQVETSAHDGFNAIAYTHRPSSNVKEVLYYNTHHKTGNSSVGILKSTYTPDGKQLIEDRKFCADASCESIKTYNPVDGRLVSDEFIYHASSPSFRDTKTVYREDGSTFFTAKTHKLGKELITTVEKNSQESFPIIKQMLDGELYASVQKNPENGDIIMELPILDSCTAKPIDRRIKYTFSHWGTGKQVEVYSKDGTLELSKIYDNSGTMTEGFTHIDGLLSKLSCPHLNVSKGYIENEGYVCLDYDILQFLFRNFKW